MALKEKEPDTHPSPPIKCKAFAHCSQCPLCAPVIFGSVTPRPEGNPERRKSTTSESTRKRRDSRELYRKSFATQ